SAPCFSPVPADSCGQVQNKAAAELVRPCGSAAAPQAGATFHPAPWPARRGSSRTGPAGHAAWRVRIARPGASWVRQSRARTRPPAWGAPARARGAPRWGAGGVWAGAGGVRDEAARVLGAAAAVLGAAAVLAAAPRVRDEAVRAVDAAAVLAAVALARVRRTTAAPCWPIAATGPS